MWPAVSYEIHKLLRLVIRVNGSKKGGEYFFKILMIIIMIKVKV